MASEETLKFNNIDDFLNYHTPALKGALWIHSEETPEKSLPFNGYNYLFDGMLEGIHKIKKDQHYIFFGEQFSSPFLLGLIKENSSEMSNFLKQFQQTLETKVSKDENLLILTPLGKALPIEVKKKLNNYKLKHLTYLL